MTMNLNGTETQIIRQTALQEGAIKGANQCLRDLSKQIAAILRIEGEHFRGQIEQGLRNFLCTKFSAPVVEEKIIKTE